MRGGQNITTMSDEKTIINESGNGTAVMGRWTRRAIDGKVGILVGTAGGAATAYAVTDNGVESTEEAAETDGAPEAASTGKPVVLDEAHLAHNVSDNMSFAQAFAAARAEVGPGGVFTWRGGVYGTYYENEWNAMDADDRARYYASISPDIKPEAAANYAHRAPQHHDETPHADTTDGGHSAHHAHNTGEGDDGDVKIISHQTAEDGTEYTAIEVGGHRGIVIGANGEPDMAIIDVDDSGSVTQPDVIIDMQTGQKMTVGDYVAQVEAQAQAQAQAEASAGIPVTHAEGTGGAEPVDCGMPDPATPADVEPTALDMAMDDGAGMATDVDLVSI